jgi:hypothetical protein
MLRISSDQIKGKVIRPAPWGTEVHKLPCLVFEDTACTFCAFSVVTVKDEIITAKTTRGLKGSALRAGLAWSENYYVP